MLFPSLFILYYYLFEEIAMRNHAEVGLYLYLITLP